MHMMNRALQIIAYNKACGKDQSLCSNGKNQIIWHFKRSRSLSDKSKIRIRLIKKSFKWTKVSDKSTTVYWIAVIPTSQRSCCPKGECTMHFVFKAKTRTCWRNVALFWNTYITFYSHPTSKKHAMQIPHHAQCIHRGFNRAHYMLSFLGLLGLLWELSIAQKLWRGKGHTI
jgi:hypothetical protein